MLLSSLQTLIPCNISPCTDCLRCFCGRNGREVTLSVCGETAYNFFLICTPQNVSDISLKSALENLMKESSSSASKVSFAGSVKGEVGATKG